MRRSSIAALIALGACLSAKSASAQAAGKPQFGALLGASITSISDLNLIGEDEVGNVVSTSKSRTGLQLGAYLRYPLSASWSVQPELHYVKKGADVEYSVADASGTQAITTVVELAYVEVPVLLRYDFSGGAGMRPFIVGGPSVALRTTCTIGIAEFNASSDCADVEDDIGNAEDPIKKTDFGVMGGIGVEGVFGKRSLSAQVRYSQGLVTIAKESGNLSPRNRGISILFGIGF